MYQHSADSVSGKKLVNDMTAILSCNEDMARMWCQQYNLQSLADLRDVALAVSQTTQLCYSTIVSLITLPKAIRYIISVVIIICEREQSNSHQASTEV
eukprot:SAG31_NODE_340_length_17466_cov_5.689987_4_plen_98_part_00